MLLWHVPSIDSRDTRFMRRELCAVKCWVGAFETDWAGHRFQLRHQPNVLEGLLANYIDILDSYFITHDLGGECRQVDCDFSPIGST
jgi:hypothetical protein